MPFRIEKRGQRRPKQWKKYLRNDQNKSKNVKFLLEDWSHPTRNAHLLPPANFFNCPSQTFRLSLKDGLIECVSELICDQEEADTKVFLCTKHAESFEVSAACISTVDSDIAIYAVFYFANINSYVYRDWYK